MNEPSPALSEAAGFSPACVDWVSKCLIKDPAQRWTAEQLLAHPWMAAASSSSSSSSAGAIDPKQWPPTFSAERVAANERDLTAVVRAIAEHYYCRAGSPAYRGSLFEMARFERVAEQFGVATAKVKKLFEAQLKELKELAVAAASTAMGALTVGK
jgi:hypothetical protein